MPTPAGRGLAGPAHQQRQRGLGRLDPARRHRHHRIEVPQHYVRQGGGRGLQQLDRYLRVQGRVSIDGSAGRANTFIIGNAYVSDVIGSAGDNTIRVATGANSLTVTNGRLTFAASGGQTLVSTFTNVNDFAITVQDNGRVVDTTGFTGVTTKTYLSDLKSGYQASNGPALSLLFPPPATPAWTWAWKAYARSRT